MESREPITWELRLFLADPYKEWVPNKKQELQDALSAIDAVHAGLEAENAKLRERVAVLDESVESMHDGGDITDELREYALGWDERNRVRRDLTAIADRIDAEHERQLEVLYRDMSDAEYVKLPVDADGEPIHIDDVMEWPTTGETFEVVGIGDGTLFYVEDGNECADWTGASTKRHHHAPTVEDVLLEFLDEAEHFHSLEEERDAISEYAAKLRLAGDAE